MKAALRRALRALHATLGRWLARLDDAPPPVVKRRSSWFDCNPSALALPRSAEDEEAEAWYRAHFRSGWPQ